VGVKVGVGGGVEVVVGLGETAARGPLSGAGVAEVAGVLVASGDGIGCEVHAARKINARIKRCDFMRAIMAET
jgi:hypothetical protein